MAHKSMFRIRLKIRGRSLFQIRDRKGRITNNESIGRALAADRRKKAKKTVKPGQGFRGDLKKRPVKRKSKK